MTRRARDPERAERTKAWRRVAHFYGAFSRSVLRPAPTDPTAGAAVSHDGARAVVAPAKAWTKPKRIASPLA